MTVSSGRSSRSETPVSDNGSGDTGYTQGKRRAASKKVNYNEKEADDELVRRIKSLEKSKQIKQHEKKNGATKRAGNGKKLPKGNYKYHTFLYDKKTPWNFIPSLPTSYRKHTRFSTMLNIDDMTIDVSQQQLISDNSIVLRQNDHIYMVSEPPGEPYYIGRVVEFVPRKEFRTLISSSLHLTSSFPALYFLLKMNWYYRPRDIQEKTSNTSSRLVYASLHNDLCPLYSYRGKCTVKCEKDFENNEALMEHVSKPNSFYFSQVFDRYTLRYYEIERTDALREKLGPNHEYFKILSSRFPYVFYEEKFPLHNVLQKYVCGLRDDNNEVHPDWDMRCGECREWCHSSSSIRCFDCNTIIHLWCMDPPLEKKPAKGVVWTCSNCVARQNNLPYITKDEEWQEIKNSVNQLCAPLKSITRPNSVNKENWWFQYLGEDMCSHLSDPLFDDYVSPFPWKKSRVNAQKGQWNKCNEEWKFKPYSDEASERGSENTVDVLWKRSPDDISDEDLTLYVDHCKGSIPSRLDVQPEACNFYDITLKLLMDNEYNSNSAFKKASELVTRELLKEPSLSQKEIALFEEGVGLYGSELHPVCKHVGTQPMSMIVRYYYYWKKTPNGRRIWGSFKGRTKNKKKPALEQGQGGDSRSSDLGGRETKRTFKPKFQPSEELKHIDDSSFDSEKISKVKSCFQCMFCSLDYSPLWYRITGGSEDDHVHMRLVSGVLNKTGPEEPVAKDLQSRKTSKEVKDDKLNALCIRCARLWRRYGVRWTQPSDVFRQMYGNSVNSLQQAVEEMLDGSDSQALTCTIQQAFSKNVDWELVVDAESITKQRYLMLENPDHLLKVKRNTLSSQAQMNKSVRRLIDPESNNTEYLGRRLRAYVGGLQDKVKRQEERARKRKEKKEQERIASLKAAQHRLKTESTVLPNSDQTHGSILNENTTRKKVLLPKMQPVPYSKSSFVKKVLSSGELLINLESELHNGKLGGSLTIDSNFANLRLPDVVVSLVKQLNDKRKLDDEDLSSNSRKRPKSDSTETAKPHFMVNKNDIPTLKSSEVCRSAILRMYNRISPNYYHKRFPAVSPGESKGIGMHLKSDVQNQKQIPNKHDLLSPILNKLKPSDCTVVEGAGDPWMDNAFNNLQAPNKEDLSCLNCGIKAHPEYTGRKLTPSIEMKASSKLWMCDPCSNDRNPLVSTNYKCLLCKSSNDRVHDNPVFKNPLSGVMKCTADGLWCHILCAVYSNGARFGSSDDLQPVVTTNSLSSTNGAAQCDICTSDGRFLCQCDVCDRKFHISCCAESKGFFLGFKKSPKASMQPTTDDVCIVEEEEAYVIRPIVICPDHEITAEYVPFDYMIKGTNTTLLEFYVRNQKSDPYLKTLSTLQLRSKNWDMKSLDSRMETHSDNASGEEQEASFSKVNQLIALLSKDTHQSPIPAIEDENEDILQYVTPSSNQRSSELLSLIDTTCTSFEMSKDSKGTTQQSRSFEPSKKEVKVEAQTPMKDVVKVEGLKSSTVDIRTASCFPPKFISGSIEQL